MAQRLKRKSEITTRPNGVPAGVIWFYEKGEEYYELTNFQTGYPIKTSLPKIVNNKVMDDATSPELDWPTSEHLFQAIKFIGQRDKINGILNSISAKEAQIKATSYGSPSNWRSVNVSAMEWVLRKKFEQHKELRELLEDTGTDRLVEHTTNDKFWGDGGDGGNGSVGQNKLGELLMQLRKKYQQQSKWTPPPPNGNPNQPTPDPDPNKGPDNPTPKQPDKSPDQGDTPQPDDTPSKSPEPTSEEVNNAKEKLKNARKSNNKDEIESALSETKDIIEKSSDPDLKKEKELTENELGKLDEKKLREFIRQEVVKELTKLGIKKDDLSSASQQKLDELNNNNNNNISADQAKNLRTGVLNEVGAKALDKLIAEVKSALKSGDEKKIATKAKELRQFTEDGSDEYVQNAYLQKKNDIQSLLDRAKKVKKSSDHQEQDGFWRLNNPVMWLIGTTIIGLVIAALLIIRARGKRH